MWAGVPQVSSRLLCFISLDKCLEYYESTFIGAARKFILKNVKKKIGTKMEHVSCRKEHLIIVMGKTVPNNGHPAHTNFY